MAIAEERMTKIRNLVKQVNSHFGAEMITFLGETGRTVDVIPTHSFAVNQVLGIGGIPKGKITEIYGPEHTAKSGLVLGVLANAQKKGLAVALVDAERATSTEYLERMGVDVDTLLYVQPDTGEDGLNVVESLVNSGLIDVIGVDSVAALVPEAEIKGEMGDSHVAPQARLMSQAMRKLTGCVAKNNVALMFTNQIREKVGVMFGSPETTPGGRALRFYSSLRIELRRGESITGSDKVVGVKIKVHITKNRLSTPFQRTEFPVIFNQKPDPVIEIFYAAFDVLTRSGAWYSLCDENGNAIEGNTGIYKFQGKSNVLKAMRQDPGLVELIKDRLEQQQPDYDTEDELEV